MDYVYNLHYELVNGISFIALWILLESYSFSFIYDIAYIWYYQYYFISYEICVNKNVYVCILHTSFVVGCRDIISRMYKIYEARYTQGFN